MIIFQKSDEDALEGFLFFGILLLPFIAVLVALASSVEEFGPKTKKCLQTLVKLTPAFSFAAYGLYEYRMPVQMDIRGDIFFIFPALIISCWPFVVYRNKFSMPDGGIQRKRKDPRLFW